MWAEVPDSLFAISVLLDELESLRECSCAKSIANLVLLPMTCRLYIDEVGNGDLNGAADDPNIRYLSLTGIIMKTAAHDRRLQPAIDALKAVHLGDIGDNPRILHRREIMRSEGCFSPLKDDEARGRFNEDLLRIMRDQPYLAITVTIDKKQHLETYETWRFDPYHYCMTCLVERYVRWLARNELRGDVIAEARFKKVDKKLKASFDRLYRLGSPQMGAAQFQSRLTSKNLGLFPKKSNVAALQLADLLAHPSARYMRRARDGEDQPEDFGNEVVKILLAAKYARNPKTKVIDGWGTKWLP